MGALCKRASDGPAEPRRQSPSAILCSTKELRPNPRWPIEIRKHGRAARWAIPPFCKHPTISSTRLYSRKTPAVNPPSIPKLLQKLLTRQDLTNDEVGPLFDAIMKGQLGDAELAA